MPDGFLTSSSLSYWTYGGLYKRQAAGYLLATACPTPNLGSGAHAAGIGEAKEA